MKCENCLNKKIKLTKIIGIFEDFVREKYPIEYLDKDRQYDIYRKYCGVCCGSEVIYISKDEI